MGLFGFGKKKPEKRAPSQEETARRWQEAYRANPKVYQKDNALMGSCALTEGADTLLPLHPEAQWAAGGRPIPNWTLGLVSMTEERVLGYVPYQAAMERLAPFSLAASEGWVLIRAMTHDELAKLSADLPQTLI